MSDLRSKSNWNFDLWFHEFHRYLSLVVVDSIAVRVYSVHCTCICRSLERFPFLCNFISKISKRISLISKKSLCEKYESTLKHVIWCNNVFYYAIYTRNNRKAFNTHTVNDGIDLHIRLVTILIATNRDNMHRDERVELTTGDRMNR